MKATEPKKRGRPRGRHAKPGCDLAPVERFTVPLHKRLGFRPFEYAALIGVSRVTIWRGIRSGKIPVVDHCGLKIIPRQFVVRAGFISDDDGGDVNS